MVQRQHLKDQLLVVVSIGPVNNNKNMEYYKLYFAKGV